MNFNIFIPGLKEVVVKKWEETGGMVRIYVEMPRKAHRCPSCRERTSKVHDYRIHKIHHLKWFERTTQLFYRRRRYAWYLRQTFLRKIFLLKLSLKKN